MKQRKLMVAGLTEIEEEIRNVGARQLRFNRTPDFCEYLLSIEAKLKQLFRTKNDVYILASSGTGAMEAAVVNVLSPGDEVVVASGGVFGQRWHEIASRFGAKCNLIEVPQGDSITAEQIRKAMTAHTRAVFVTAHETSLGIVVDLKSIAEVVRSTGTILVVDAISSLGAEELEMDHWGLDVVITSSQKALSLPPGLAFISVSDKAWACVEQSKMPKYYFDLKMFRADLRRGHTPFTPPISLLYQLEARLDKILKIGIDAMVEKQARTANYLRQGLEQMGFEIIGKKQANGVVGIKFPGEIDAYKVIEALRYDHGIEISPNYGGDRSKLARIGLFGSVSDGDVDVILNALKSVMENMGVTSTARGE